MFVASPMMIARALSEHQHNSNNYFDRKEAKSKFMLFRFHARVAYVLVSSVSFGSLPSMTAFGKARRI
eukprot:6744161-Heterocapsa_arctica.AAC.1